MPASSAAFASSATSRMSVCWMLVTVGARPSAASTEACITATRSSRVRVGNSPPAPATRSTPSPVRTPRSIITSMFVRSEPRSSEKSSWNGVGTATTAPRSHSRVVANVMIAPVSNMIQRRSITHRVRVASRIVDNLEHPGWRHGVQMRPPTAAASSGGSLGSG